MDVVSYDVLKRICMELTFGELKNLQRSCRHLRTALNSKKLQECWHWKYGALWKQMPLKRKYVFIEDPIVCILKGRDELKGEEMVAYCNKYWRSKNPSTCERTNDELSISPNGYIYVHLDSAFVGMNNYISDAREHETYLNACKIRLEKAQRELERAMNNHESLLNMLKDKSQRCEKFFVRERVLQIQGQVEELADNYRKIYNK